MLFSIPINPLHASKGACLEPFHEFYCYRVSVRKNPSVHVQLRSLEGFPAFFSWYQEIRGEYILRYLYPDSVKAFSHKASVLEKYEGRGVPLQLGGLAKL